MGPKLGRPDKGLLALLDGVSSALPGRAPLRLGVQGRRPLERSCPWLISLVPPGLVQWRKPTSGRRDDNGHHPTSNQAKGKLSLLKTKCFLTKADQGEWAPSKGAGGTELSRVEQVCRYRSIKMTRSHPITSDQIRPNPTKIKPEKSEFGWRVRAGTPGSHREHMGAVCSMAPRKSQSHSRTCSACGSYQMSHCERFGLRRSGAVLGPAVQKGV